MDGRVGYAGCALGQAAEFNPVKGPSAGLRVWPPFTPIEEGKAPDRPREKGGEREHQSPLCYPCARPKGRVCSFLLSRWVSQDDSPWWRCGSQQTLCGRLAGSDGRALGVINQSTP